MYEENGKTIVMWQTPPEEIGIAEPALMLQCYGDTLSIQQEDRYISINYESIPELIKVLKKAKLNQ